MKHSFVLAVSALLMTTAAVADTEVTARADRPLNVLIPNPPMSGQETRELTVEWRLTCVDGHNLRSIGRPAAIDRCLTATASFDGLMDVAIEFPGALLYSLSRDDFNRYRNSNCPTYTFSGPNDAASVAKRSNWRLEYEYDSSSPMSRPSYFIRAVTDQGIRLGSVDSGGNLNFSDVPVKMTGFSLRQFGSKLPNGDHVYGVDDPNTDIWHERETVGAINSGRFRIDLRVHGAALPGSGYGLSEMGGGRPCVGGFSPLMLFFDERRPQFTGASRFPLSNIVRNITWPEAKAPGYFLAYDRDGSGKIERGNELFGTGSLGDKPNGFETLKEFDSDKNGVIDARDKKFHALLLWQDWNGNGQSEDREVKRLSEMGVLSISLKYRNDRFTPTERAELREYSEFTFRNKAGKLTKGTIIDVWFLPGRNAWASEYFANATER